MRFRIFLAGLALCILGFAPQTHAADKSWYFPAWDVDIAIHKDATIVVREEQTFDFTGNFHYVTRTIPLKKVDNIRDVRVFDKETGVELSGDAVSVTRAADNVVIQVNFDLTDTTHTWIFQYTVDGGIGYFDDHDELYWNAVSHDRDVPIEHADVTVHLPASTDESLMKATVFSTDDISAEARIADDRTFAFHANEELDAQTDFTIVAGWPRGIVDNPGVLKLYSTPSDATISINGAATPYKTDAILRGGKQLTLGAQHIELRKFGYEVGSADVSVGAGDTKTTTVSLQEFWWHRVGRLIVTALIVLWIISPIGVLIWLIRRWLRVGRDPKTATGTTLIAQYEPPDKCTPSEVGTLLDEKADIRDVIPALVDLATRGYITIIETQSAGLLRKQQFAFEKRKEWAGDAQVTDFERLILDGMFKGGAIRVEQKELENKFYKELPAIFEALYAAAVTRGYYAKSPEKTRAAYLIAGGVLLAIGGALTAVMGFGIPLLIDGALVMLFAGAMPARTEKGRLAYEYALGFKEYLYTAERFRVQDLTPELFVRFLAYAMIFGIEKEWAKKFEGIGAIKPDWYQSGSHASGVGFINGFSAASFAQSMSAMSTSVAHSATVSPSSSASGGSGFGGGAGGGGGGGGSGAG